MHLSQYEFYTRKREPPLGMKFHLDFHRIACWSWRRALTNGSDVNYVFPRCRTLTVRKSCVAKQVFQLELRRDKWVILILHNEKATGRACSGGREGGDGEETSRAARTLASAVILKVDMFSCRLLQNCISAFSSTDLQCRSQAINHARETILERIPNEWNEWMSCRFSPRILPGLKGAQQRDVVAMATAGELLVHPAQSPAVSRRLERLGETGAGRDGAHGVSTAAEETRTTISRQKGSSRQPMRKCAFLQCVHLDFGSVVTAQIDEFRQGQF